MPLHVVVWMHTLSMVKSRNAFVMKKNRYHTFIMRKWRMMFLMRETERKWQRGAEGGEVKNEMCVFNL